MASSMRADLVSAPAHKGNDTSEDQAFLAGGGEMGERIRSHNWAATPLGSPSTWPTALRSAVSIMLGSSFPTAIYWGPELRLLYNDAWAPIPAERHPDALGRAGKGVWPDIWHIVGPQFEDVLRTGKGVSTFDQMLPMVRNGLAQETYWNYSLSAIRNDDGGIAGVFNQGHETTGRVLAERRLRQLNESLEEQVAARTGERNELWALSRDIMLRCGFDGRILTVNPAWTEVLGWREDELIGRLLFDFIHRDDLEYTRTAAASHKAGGSYSSFENRYRRRDGTYRWISWSTRPTDAVITAVGRDITMDKEAAEALSLTEEALRQAQERELEASEAKYQVLTNAMPQMVWSTLRDGFHDYYNAQWYEFTGVPVGSTDGEGWNGMFHPDDQERAWERWRHSLATGEPYEIEYRLRHHSGDYRWVLGRALPVRDPKGAIIRWIGTCTDIDESKRSAERNELLSRELSHRIKNIFAVISGLVSLTGSRKGELRPIVKELLGRIAALGRAHEFARPHSAQSAPKVGESTLHGLLSVLLSPYSVDGSCRISIRGADPMVDDKGATPLALVIHELATNAAKYGALSTSEGHVTIDISDQGGKLELIWTENGGPPITGSPTRHGFGTDLAELSVSRQLGGEISKEWPPEGLKVTMRIDAKTLHRGTQSV